MPAPAAQISWSRIDASVTPRPEPPYSSGTRIPSQPPAAKAFRNSQGYSALRSFSSQYSGEKLRATAATSFLINSCCSVSAKSMYGSPGGRPPAATRFYSIAAGGARLSGAAGAERAP